MAVQRRIRSHGGVRTWLSGLIALAFIAIAAAPVSADTDLGKVGKIGKRSLTEPAVTCNYYYFIGVLWDWQINPPVVYARDSSPGRDVQTVGWRVVIKRWIDGEAKPRLYDRTRIHKALAYDDQPAVFELVDRQPNMYEDLTLNGSYYYVIIKLFWYDAAGKVVGKDSRRVDQYVQQIATADGSTSTYVAGSCHRHWIAP